MKQRFTDLPCLIPGITCDNASANDKMIGTLANIIRCFPGPANWVRCLVHVVNLVVKVILCHFDGVKKYIREGFQVDNMVVDQPPEDDDLDDMVLVDLMKDVEKEEKEMDDGDDEDDIEIEDNLTEVERALRQEIDDVVVAHETKPVRHVLYKVRPYSLHLSCCQQHSILCAPLSSRNLLIV